MEQTESLSQLSEQELAILRDFERARHLKDLLLSPGWKIYLEIRDLRISQLKEQFMRAKKVDRDALWAMQVRLDGILDFAEIWHEGIKNAVECLEPEAMQRIISGLKTNPADLDGDLP
jgi:hypothetical protein